MLVLKILAAWVAVSIPVSLLAGRWLAANSVDLDCACGHGIDRHTNRCNASVGPSIGCDCVRFNG